MLPDSLLCIYCDVQFAQGGLSRALPHGKPPRIFAASFMGEKYHGAADRFVPGNFVYPMEPEGGYESKVKMQEMAIHLAVYPDTPPETARQLAS